MEEDCCSIRSFKSPRNDQENSNNSRGKPAASQKHVRIKNTPTFDSNKIMSFVTSLQHIPSLTEEENIDEISLTNVKPLKNKSTKSCKSQKGILNTPKKPRSLKFIKPHSKSLNKSSKSIKFN